MKFSREINKRGDQRKLRGGGGGVCKNHEKINVSSPFVLNLRVLSLLYVYDFHGNRQDVRYRPCFHHLNYFSLLKMQFYILKNTHEVCMYSCVSRPQETKSGRFFTCCCFWPIYRSFKWYSFSEGLVVVVQFLF